MNKQQIVRLLESLLTEEDDQISVNDINKAISDLQYCDWVSWCIDDVESVAPWLTVEECRQALSLACDKYHDAESGVNWDTLRFCAEQVREQPEDWSDDDEEE